MLYVLSIENLYLFLFKFKTNNMKQNWYKSREEIKEEKRRNRRLARNIIVGYLIFASIVLILSYCENR